jgi:proteasome lid subunit RPN8/RPN11
MSDPHAKNKSGKAAALEPTVLIDSEVTRRIRQHARAHPKTEVCGVLIGEDAGGTIEIDASIEGVDAAQAGTHVTFTQDAWESIYKVKDELYPEARIVGWYHSHPGFGVFLSEHDMFIQENFFSSPGQVAWVYDPHTDEEGCFGWVGGEVHRLSALSIADKNGDGTERTPKKIESTLEESEFDSEDYGEGKVRESKAAPVWMRWTATALSYLATLVVGFFIAYFLFPHIVAVVANPVTGQLELRDAHELLPYIDGRLPLPQGPMVGMPPPEPGSPAAQPSAAPPQAAPQQQPAPQQPPGGHP